MAKQDEVYLVDINSFFSCFLRGSDLFDNDPKYCILRRLCARDINSVAFHVTENPDREEGFLRARA